MTSAILGAMSVKGWGQGYSIVNPGRAPPRTANNASNTSRFGRYASHATKVTPMRRVCEASMNWKNL